MTHPVQQAVRKCVVLSSILLLAATYSSAEDRDQPAEFVVWSDAAEFKPPQIVVQFDPTTGTGVDWKLTAGRPWYDASDAAKLGDAVDFLHEAVERMCGRQLEVINSADLSRGIVLTTLAAATDDIRGDAEVQAALKSDGSDAYNHHGKDGYYIARDLPYGISAWNRADRAWEKLVDKTLFKQPSVEVQLPKNDRKHHLVAVRYKAPRPGTYRFEISFGGNLAYLTDLGFDPASGQHTGGRSLTFDGNAEGLTQSPTYIYIPKGTKTLDLEVWDAYGAKAVTLHKSLPPTSGNISRKVDISTRRTHRVELTVEETGTIAVISGNGFAFPYLYSVPMLWSKSPGQLLVPQAVAAADGLTELAKAIQP